MMKLTLAFALLITAAAAAHAQDRTPVGTPYPQGSSEIYPKKIADPVQLDEAHIAASRAAGRPSDREANENAKLWKYTTVPTFKAEIKVKNSSAKAIQSVAWTATLLDPETGAVIRSYDVTTEAQIKPGKTKKLSERLQKPRADTVSADSRGAKVADLKVKVTSVTYVDGSTSTTP